jgi:hypothetical protein
LLTAVFIELVYLRYFCMKAVVAAAVRPNYF